MRFQELTQGSLMPKISLFGQKLWPIARGQTDKQTDRQTDRQTEIVKTEGPIEFFWSFLFLYFFIDERSNKTNNKLRQIKN